MGNSFLLLTRWTSRTENEIDFSAVGQNYFLIRAKDTEIKVQEIGLISDTTQSKVWTFAPKSLLWLKTYSSNLWPYLNLLK